MKYLTSYCILLAVLLFGAGSIHIQAQVIPTPGQIDQIQKKLDSIKQLKNQGKKDDDSTIRRLAQEAIILADSFYKIPPANLVGEPKYDPNYPGDGSSSKSGKKVKVKIGPPGLSSPGWLASTKCHEIEGHGGQAADSPSRWYTDPKGTEINEVEAYDLEIKKAGQNGLTQAEIDELKKRRKEHYEALDSANRAKIDSEKLANKPYTLALAPTTGGSVVVLGGVVTTLYTPSVAFADDRMLVTVRQKDPVEKLLITLTANDKSTTALTDAYGHALLDISAVSRGLPDKTTATVTCSDASGKPLVSASVAIMQTDSWILDPPVVDDWPEKLNSGSVLTIHGKNLGPDAKIICGRTVQETLSASDTEITAYIDAPGGTQAVFIVTSSGVGRSRVVKVEPRLQAFQQQFSDTFTITHQNNAPVSTTTAATAGGSFRK